MCEGQVASPQGVQTAEDGQAAGDRVTALHAQQAGHATSAVDLHDLCRRRREEVSGQEGQTSRSEVMMK